MIELLPQLDKDPSFPRFLSLQPNFPDTNSKAIAILYNVLFLGQIVVQATKAPYWQLSIAPPISFMWGKYSVEAYIQRL